MNTSLLQPLSLLQFLLAIVACILAFFVGSSVAYAQTPLEVDFEFEPLFVDADVKPGDSTTRTVTVTNNSNDTQNLYFRFENTMNTGLGDVMLLDVIDSNGNIVSATTSFANRFLDGEILLGQIAPNSSITYLFTASIPTTVGNDYQLTQFGFDLVVGFQGGESISDTPTGGGGGGQGGGFSLFNEGVVVNGDSATINWNTNRNASSHVVCRLLDGRPFVLGTESPFGYDFIIPEVDSQTQTHSMTQTGLAPGQYECRPASRERLEDGFTTGRALTFEITAPEGLVAGEDISLPPVTPQPIINLPGTVLGVQASEYGKAFTDGLTYEEWQRELERQRAEREQEEQEDRDGADTDSQTEGQDRDRNGTTDREQGRSTTETTILWLLFIIVIATLGYVVYRKKIA